MLVPIQQYAKNLIEKEDGFWVVNENHEVSYTPDGHKMSFQLEEKSFWYQYRNTLFLTILKKFPSEWLLDIGGGTGFVALFLQKKGISTVVLEPVLSGALLCKERQIKQVICGQLEDVDFQPNSLPAISLFDVLEHIEEDELFLKKCNEVLKPNGRIYITVPAYQSLWSDFDVRVGHFRRYTLKILKKRLENTGFTVEYSSYFFYFLPIFIWIFRVLRHKKYDKNSFQKKEGEHLVSSPLSSFTVSFLLKTETLCFRIFGQVPFGSSCLIVGKKRA
jgi:ubiquinone/menaquinone biosynthesis C-methylase UbiE